MTLPSVRKLASILTLLLAVLLPLPIFGAQPVATEKGDLWEITSQMSMEGMPGTMPARTKTQCMPKEWREPPGGGDERMQCQTLDFNSTPTKSTWRMVCAGPPEMTGVGEITRDGSTAYSGFIKMSSSEGTVTINLRGKRVGDCDAAVAKKEAAQEIAMMEKLQKDAAASQAEFCKQMAEAMNLQMVLMEGSTCNDPATRQALCRQVGTEEGFKQLSTRGSIPPENSLQAVFAFCSDAGTKAGFCKHFQTVEGFNLFAAASPEAGDSLDQASAYCGVNPADLKVKLCKEAAKTENLDFLGRNCPDQAKVIAERECAGRKYTSMGGSKYASFCLTYAAEMMAGAAPAETAESDKSKKGKTKKFLKGIWPN